MHEPDRVARIRATLQTSLQPQRLHIIDDSAAHVGHSGARDGKGHFRVEIVAQCFAGLPPLRRHKLVYSALDALLASDIHALSIDARAPGET